MTSSSSSTPLHLDLAKKQSGPIARATTCADCLELANLNEQIGIDLDNSEREVRRLRRRVTKLEGEISELKSEKVDARVEDVKTVIREWARLTGRTGRRAPKHIARGQRAELVAARLEDGFTVEDLIRAVGWLAEFPNVGPRGRVSADTPGSKRYDEIKYAVDGEVRVQEILDRLDVPEPESEPAEPEPIRRPRSNFRGFAKQPTIWRDPIQLVLGALETRDCNWKPGQADTWSAQCPAHEDRDPSLSIRQTDDGTILLHCFAGCDADAVLAALGLGWAELFPVHRRAA